MDKNQALSEIETLYQNKKQLLIGLDEKSAATTMAKKVLEVAKLRAMSLPEFAELKNDKSRDAFLKQQCESEYEDVDKKTMDEFSARANLALSDLDIERMRMIVKINCEWQS